MAEDPSAVTLTITPPLVKVDISPGQTWSSVFRLVNNGDRTLPITLGKVDFTSGPDGGVRLLEPERDQAEINDRHRYSMSQWIILPSEPIVLAPQESRDIAFTIEVPEGAEPGGHYGAILAGTEPVEASGSLVKISSMLTTLLLVNVPGEIDLAGEIDEFSTGRYIYDHPPVGFTVRFKNRGNVHVQPQGEIYIKDMFGRERGRLPINHATEFGNVLPDSTRKWDFTWDREVPLWEMGRYKASLVLGFGNSERRTVYADRYFWVIDYKLLAGLLSGLVLLIWLATKLIRYYVRRAVLEAQKAAGLIDPPALVGNAKRISVIPESATPQEGEPTVKRPPPGRPDPSGRKRLRLAAILLFVASLIVAAYLLWYYYRPSGSALNLPMPETPKSSSVCPGPWI